MIHKIYGYAQITAGSGVAIIGATARGKKTEHRKEKQDSHKLFFLIGRPPQITVK
jgi:hypothetical protein